MTYYAVRHPLCEVMSTTLQSTDSATTQGRGFQLHTLRDSPDPLSETIRTVADAGYEGVEFAGRFLQADPYAVRTALRETNTEPIAAHVDLDRLESNAEAIVDRCLAAGCPRVIVPHVGNAQFRTTDRAASTAKRLNAVADRLAVDGIEFGIHTTRGMFLPVLDRYGLGAPARIPLPMNGWSFIADAIGTATGIDESAIETHTGFGTLLAETTDQISFEVDIGWVAAAGFDPAFVFSLLGDRLFAIHIADVALTRRIPPVFESAAPGEGIVDLPTVLRAARQSDASWLVFEDDDSIDPQSSLIRGIEILTQDRDR